MEQSLTNFHRNVKVYLLRKAGENCAAEVLRDQHALSGIDIPAVRKSPASGWVIWTVPSPHNWAFYPQLPSLSISWPIKLIYYFTTNHSAQRASLGLMCLSLHSGVSLWRWQLANMRSGSNASSAINDQAYKPKISPNHPLFKVKSCPGGPKSGNASLKVTTMTPCGRKKDQLERCTIINDCREFEETASHFAVTG